MKFLGTNPGIGQESLDSQMERLIVALFKATQIQTLLIIDGLDKCDSQGGYSINSFLSSLFKCMNGIPNAKIFITGHPVDRIFRLTHTAEALRLHEVTRSLVDADIKLCFRAWLRDYGKRVMYHHLPEDWPSSDWIGGLYHLARGSFLNAAGLAYQACQTMAPPWVAVIRNLIPLGHHEQVVGILPTIEQF